MEKTRGLRLDWILGFVQMDLDQISKGDRAKLAVEAMENLFPPALMIGFDMPGPIREKGGFMTSPPAPDNPEYWDGLRTLQSYLKDKIEMIMGLEPGRGKVSEMMDRCFITINLPKKTFSFRVVPFPVQYHHLALFILFDLLDGIPQDRLKKCQQCGKIFFIPSQRAKKFCSTRCQWNFNAEKYRREHPEEYREKQRIIMSRIRERKKKGREEGGEKSTNAFIEKARKVEKAIWNKRADGADLRTED